MLGRCTQSLLPQSLLDHERVRAQLNYALNLMNSAMADGSGLPPFNPPGPAAHTAATAAAEPAAMPGSYGGMPMGYVPAGGAQQAAAAQAAHAAAAAAAMPGRDASLRELVQRYAEENGVDFVPRPGRTHEGMQVYSFGGVSCVVDVGQQVVRANINSVWATVSLQMLLAAAKRGGS